MTTVRSAPVASAVRLALMCLAVAITYGAGAGGAGAMTASSTPGNCPSEDTVMTSNDWQATTNSAVTTDSGYVCAQEDHSGDQSIGADKTHTWSTATSVEYFPQYYCYDTTSSSVTVAHAEIFGSASYTATNWLAASATADNTRHWSAAVLWTLGAATVTGFTNGCDVSDQVWDNPPQTLRISRLTASGLPDNGTATAGKAYTITVTVSPASATGKVGLLDSQAGTADSAISAAGASLVDGTATFTWIPAISGSRIVQVAYQGDAGTTGAVTDSLPYTVVDGNGLQIKGMSPDTTTGKAIATVAVTPTSYGGTVAILDLDQVNPKTGKAPLPVGSATAAGGTASISLTYAPGTTHRFVASITDPSGNVLGQSYVHTWTSPPPMALGLPTSAPYAYLTSTVTATLSKAVAGGANAKLYANGGLVDTVAMAAGATVARFSWTPSKAGPTTLIAYYEGDSAVPATSTLSGQITVVNGYKVSVRSTTHSGSVYSTTVGVTTSASTTGIAPPPYTGKVYLYNNVQSTKAPAGSNGNGTLLGSATVNSYNGEGTIAYTAPSGALVVSGYVVSGSGYWFSGPVTLVAAKRLERSTAAPRATAERPSQPTQTSREGERIRRTRPAGAGVATGLSLVNRTMKVRATGSRSLAATCPTGSTLLHAEAVTRGPLDAIAIQPTQTGATFESPIGNAGYRTRTQLVCRASSADLLATSRYALGTPRADRIALTGRGGTAFGGPGRDRLAATGARSVLWGGLGGDRLVVASADSAADGGPGRDRLVATGVIRALLVGGAGQDVLIGSRGPSVLNAVDGQGGDRVICRSAATRVTADPGDVITGPCTDVAIGTGGAP